MIDLTSFWTLWIFPSHLIIIFNNDFFKLFSFTILYWLLSAPAEALLEQVLRAPSPLFLVSLPDSDCLSAGLATKVENSAIIPREPLLSMFFCLQAAATPALTSSLFTTIRSPKTYLLVPLDALLILAFMFIPFFCFWTTAEYLWLYSSWFSIEVDKN